MNSFIETLNGRGENFLTFAWPMLWQSSLLIVVLLAFDFLVRRKVRASVRYTLWLVVLVKLCVPPTLALPTSPAWWLHKTPVPVAAKPEIHYTVTYDNTPLPEMPSAPLPAFVPPKPVMTYAAWLLAASVAVSSSLLLWLLMRWWQIMRLVRRAAVSERLTVLADAARQAGGMKFKVPVKLTTNSMSPAVCGLFRPAILIPQPLAEHFSDEQMRAVLLHELIHLRRRDVWMNVVQALLQIAYWWHPLVWVANARIRRVREEAVDDAVMLALRDEAEAYAPTLLEVAKLALNRPLVSLGLVGIMESRNALRQRIERLLDFRPPRQAGLTLVSLLGVLAFTTVAVPMGEGPVPAPVAANADAVVSASTAAADTNLVGKLRDPNFRVARELEKRNTDDTSSEPPPVQRVNQATSINRVETATQAMAVGQRTTATDTNVPQVLITAYFCEALAPDLKEFEKSLRFNVDTTGQNLWVPLPANQFGPVYNQTKAPAFRRLSTPRVVTLSGEAAQMSMSNGTNATDFDCTPVITNGQVNLTFDFRVIRPQAGVLVTNRFHTVETLESRGGLLVKSADAQGTLQSNVMVLVRVEIITDASARFQPRLQKIIKPAGGTNAPAQGGGAMKVMTLQPDGTLREDKARQVAVDAGAHLLMSFKVDSSLPEDQLKQALMDGGVKMPPTVTMYNREGGVLLVQGPADQLVLATRAVYKLNGLSSGQIDAVNRNYVKATAVVSPPDVDTNLLFTRTFKVDVRRFVAGLKNMGEEIHETTNSAREISAAARDCFSRLGVNLESPSGKSVFFNDKNGMLFVKASAADLDVVEKVVQTINQTAPQLHIKARFLQVPNGTLAGMQGISGLTNFTGAGLVGILSDANYRVAYRTLASRKDTEILGEPEVTSLSGRQCQMRTTEMVTVVTNFAQSENPTNHQKVVSPQTSAVETGPILDVVPYVLSDGYTINLAVIPSITKFLGYEKPPANAAEHVTAAGVHLPVILPKFTVRQVVATMNLWDNQTAVIGAFPEKTIVGGQEVVDKSKSNSKASDKELLIFITATIVDPAGNRVHTDEEMSSMESAIPPQPPQPTQPTQPTHPGEPVGIDEASHFQIEAAPDTLPTGGRGGQSQ